MAEIFLDKIDVGVFITEVEKRPCLWDFTTEVYKDKSRKEKEWLEVAAALLENFETLSPEHRKLIGQSIASKWRNIRDYYKKCTKKDAESGSEAAKKFKYGYANKLGFLSKLADEKWGWPKRATSKEKTYKSAFVEQPRSTDDIPVEESSCDMDVEVTQGHGKVLFLTSKKKKKEEPVAQPEPIEDDDCTFLKWILPIIKEFDLDQKLEFRAELLILVRRVRQSKPYPLTPGPCQPQTQYRFIEISQSSLAHLSSAAKIVKPEEVGANASGSSGTVENEEFILPDSLPLSESFQGRVKPALSENQKDNAQCSSSEGITIKTEPMFLDECDWELATNSPAESSEASASKSHFPTASPPSNGAYDTTDHLRRSFVAQPENQQGGGPSSSGSLKLFASAPQSSTTAPSPSSAETTTSDRVSDPKVTNIVLLSGNQSILNHQILRPELFSASERGKAESETSSSVHPPKKRRICPQGNADGGSNSPSPAEDMHAQSGLSIHQLECFGSYVVSKLRLMDPRTCLLVQKAINDIIFEAEMGKLILETRCIHPKSNFPMTASKSIASGSI